MEETDLPDPHRPARPEGAASGEGSPPLLPELDQRAAAPAAQPAVEGADPFQWRAVLSNRFILAGMGLLVLLLLATIVLVAVGGDDAGPAAERPVVLRETPEPGVTLAPRSGLAGRLVTTTSLHNGPDGSYALLGTVPRGAQVSVVGRNEDESWLQIIYPPGSELRAWVDAVYVEVSGDVSQLAVAGPGAGPSVPIPIGPPPPEELPTDEPTPLSAEPTVTPEQPPTETVAPPTRTPRPSSTPIRVSTPTPRSPDVLP